MLNSTEHKIPTALKIKLLKHTGNLALKLSDVAFILLINDKMPAIVCILTFVRRINSMLS